MSCDLIVSIATEGPRKVCITPVAKPEKFKLNVPLEFSDGIRIEGDNLMTTMTTTQGCIAGPVTGKDKNGNPAVFDAPPVWTSSDEEILSVVSSGGGAGEGTYGTIKGVGKTGNAQIVVTADADLGEGTRELKTILAFEVVGGEAVSMDVPVGEVVEQDQLPVVDPRSKRR